MNRIKSVNRVFLATVLISVVGNFLNIVVSSFTGNYLILLLISQIILIIPSAVYLSIHKIHIGTAIRFHKIKISNVILIIVFAYLISPLMNFINAVSMLFVKNEISDVMYNIVDNNSLLLSLIMVAFVPCVLEESVYRGILYNEYSKVNPLKGMLLSGLLFGLMHGNINQFSYAFAMGVIFALLIEATDSILATMIVHFVINGTSILVMWLYPKLAVFLEQFYGKDMFNADTLISSLREGTAQNLDVSFVMSYGMIAVIPTILAFIVFRAIAKNTGRWQHITGIFGKGRPETNESKVQSLFTLSLVFGIILCVGIIIINEFSANAIPDQPLEGNVASILQLIKNWR